MIGLKRGIVELLDHQTEWELNAKEIIVKLKDIFGDVATDIQHVGSTAIRGIKAKPIIDIAVSAADFTEVEALTAALKAEGLLRRGWEDDTQMLFAIGDYSKADGIVTHFIHIVKTDSTEWYNYINFRDYLNTTPSIAKEYETLKMHLAAENPHAKGREKYLAGKHDFVTAKLNEAKIWADFGRTFIKIEPIIKGWSEDKKYCVTKADGIKYLLRITPIERYDTRKSLFSMLQKVTDIEISMCKPIEFGTCSDGVYSLQSWINGEDAESVIPLLTETEQYVLGFQSGEMLRKMHSIPAPSTQEEWSTRFNRKTNIKIQKYRECGIRFEGDEKVIEYIDNNRDLLNNRPQCFQHGDYHIGNLMIENGNIAVIDFDRYDFGDPWEEFNRIVWSATISSHFATGQLNGYFGGRPPTEFFKLLAFYIASNALSSIYWAIPFGQREIDTMMKQSQDVLQWFNDMQNPVPTWYLQEFYIQYIDGVPFKLKSPFDFSFIRKYGKVFKVFDDQDSGNICFGLQNGENKYFIKFAGAPTERASVNANEAISNLKLTTPIYQDLAHPTLIRYINAEEIGGGFAVIYEWADGVCMGRMYPLSRKRFMQMSLDVKLQVFNDILAFHAYVASCGYIAIDFYDGSIMYDFNRDKTTICDIDFYAKKPYINQMGRLWGSSRFMSPEEFELGATIEEDTNVFLLGQIAFALFSDSNHSKEAWPLNKKLYNVLQKAISNDRIERQQSIKQLIDEWRANYE